LACILYGGRVGGSEVASSRLSGPGVAWGVGSIPGRSLTRSLAMAGGVCRRWLWDPPRPGGGVALLGARRTRKSIMIILICLVLSLPWLRPVDVVVGQPCPRRNHLTLSLGFFPMVVPSRPLASDFRLLSSLAVTGRPGPGAPCFGHPLDHPCPGPSSPLLAPVGPQSALLAPWWGEVVGKDLQWFPLSPGVGLGGHWGPSCQDVFWPVFPRGVALDERTVSVTRVGGGEGVTSSS
jgi:hypothetical protein